MKQLSFLPEMKISTSLAHGGDTRQGKRKIARPFDPKRPIHIVLRSARATGKWSLLRPKHRDLIERRLAKFARQYGIQVHRFANVGNHLHLLVSIEKKMDESRATKRSYTEAREAFSSFLRRFAGAIAFEVTGASKTKPVGKFWDGLAFTRVVNQGRDFEGVMRYLVKNLFEAAGLWNRKRNPEWELLWMGKPT